MNLIHIPIPVPKININAFEKYLGGKNHLHWCYSRWVSAKDKSSVGSRPEAIFDILVRGTDDATLTL